MFEEILKARVLELWNLFGASGGLAHQGEKGSFREAFVKQIIESILPFHYGIGTGVIVDSAGRQSPQVDIVIYDRRSMPPILERDGRGIYPMDAVLRVLEVKSTINTNSVEQFFNQTWCFHPDNPDGLKSASKGKLPEGKLYYPLCGMFGFSSKTKDLKKLISNLHQPHINSGLIFCAHLGTYNIGANFFTPSSDLTEGVKFFLVNFLAQIEESANSRSGFDPFNWFKFK